MGSAVRMPIKSEKPVTMRPAIGIKPKKLKPKTAETRPRRCEGACSCTIVLARPKFMESAIARIRMEQAGSKKLCDRDMKKTRGATASRLRLKNFHRLSAA